MSYKAYNDYELLYQYKEKHDEVALKILIQKYEKFIYKKVYSFFSWEKDIDDYYQEGLLCLLRAIRSFKDEFNKTFMRYFEIIINRHFINLYHRDKRDQEKILMLLNEAEIEFQMACEEPEEKIEINVSFNSRTEDLIYHYYFKEGKSVNFLIDNLKLTKKQVYNAIYRVKRKLTK